MTARHYHRRLTYLTHIVFSYVKRDVKRDLYMTSLFTHGVVDKTDLTLTLSEFLPANTFSPRVTWRAGTAKT